MHFVSIASHGRYNRPPHPKRVLAWQGRQLRPPVASHQTKGFAPCGTRTGALPLRPSQRAFVLLGTMTGAFLPLDPDRGFAPGPYPRALPSGHLPRALAAFGNHASEPSCSDTMTGGPASCDHPERTTRRSPREGARPLRRAGVSGTRSGMSGAVKARQQPAAPNVRSLP
jgi:hypothetical protein